MIVIAASCEASIEHFSFAAADGQPVNAAGSIEHEILSIWRPVRGFNMVHGMVDDAAIFGGDGNDFQGAVKHWLGCSRRLLFFERDSGEPCFLQNVVIMRAYTKTDIDRVVELQSHTRAARVEWRSGAGSVGALERGSVARRVGLAY